MGVPGTPGQCPGKMPFSVCFSKANSRKSLGHWPVDPCLFAGHPAGVPRIFLFMVQVLFRPVFPVLVFQLSEQQNRTRQPPQPYSEPLQTILRQEFPFENFWGNCFVGWVPKLVRIHGKSALSHFGTVHATVLGHLLSLRTFEFYSSNFFFFEPALGSWTHVFSCLDVRTQMPVLGASYSSRLNAKCWFSLQMIWVFLWPGSPDLIEKLSPPQNM